MKFRSLLLAFCLMAAPTVALAQDDIVTLAGTYSYTDVQETYSGQVTLSGSGPVYWLTYLDESGEANEQEGAALALAQGTVVASAFGGAMCSPATLVRQSDGALFGMWHDIENEAGTAIGMEIAIPQEATSDFAGTYDVVGSYADGSQYTAVATITANEGGWYELSYEYASDESANPAVEERGLGITVGNVLGYAYTNDDEPCEPYVLDLSGGVFGGFYLDGNGGIAEEIGERTE